MFNSVGNFGEGSMISPPLDLTNVQNPILSFYLWNNSTTTAYKKTELEISVKYKNDTNFQVLETIQLDKLSNWVHYTRGLNKNVAHIQIKNLHWGYSSVNTFIDALSVYSGPDCVAPISQKFVLASEDGQVLLSWIPLNDENKWNLKISSKSINPKTEVGDLLDSLNIVKNNTGIANCLVKGLEIGKTYYWYVQTACTSSESEWTQEKFFLVDHAPAELPFIANFDTSFNGFTIVNGTQKNKWYRGNTPLDGTSGACMYISPNGGTAYEYAKSEKSRVHIYREIVFPKEAKEGFILSFDWLCNGSEYNDVMKVHIITDMSVYPVAGQWINASYIVGPYFSLNDQWKTSSIELPAELAGKRVRLAFSWMNNIDDKEGQPPIALDNIELKILECKMPAKLQAKQVSTNFAILEWTQEGQNSKYWNIEYGELGFTLGTGTVLESKTDSIFVENLKSRTRYEFYVQNVCETNVVSHYSKSIQLDTKCEVKQAPYFDDFDNLKNNEYPLCFSKLITTGGISVLASSFYARSLPNSMLIVSADVDAKKDFMAFISPEFDDIADLNKRIRFWANIFPLLSLRVGVMSDPNDQTTFLELAKLKGVDKIDVYTNQPMTSQYTIDLTNPKITADHRYIAFVYGNEYYMKPISIDDFSYEFIPSCLEPIQVKVSTDVNSAKLTWVAQGSATKWEIACVKFGTNPDAAQNILNTSSNTYQIENLESSTTYEVYVRSVCSEQDKGPWSMPVKFTTCETSVIPFEEGFETTFPTFMTPCWSVESKTEPTWQVEAYVQPYKDKQNMFIQGKQNMNDWLFSPAIKLQAGKSYKLNFYYRAIGGNAEKLDVYIGKGPSSTFMSNNALLKIDSVSGNYKAFSVPITVDADNTYYLAWHARSEKSKGMRIDEVSLTRSTSNDIESDKFPVRIYPNPAEDKFYINNIEGNALIEIIDCMGRKVKTIEDYSAGNAIYTNNLQAGLYVVKITQKNSIKETKIIIKH
ncbi:MAG: choice-of-anchor J domain-containing protein [Bacteroidales bacterium]